MIQWERFSNFNRLVNTMAHVQRVFKKQKPATKTISVEEREGAQASIFRLMQQEQLAEEMKSLKADKEIPKNSNTPVFTIHRPARTYSCPGQKRQKSIELRSQASNTVKLEASCS